MGFTLKLLILGSDAGARHRRFESGDGRVVTLGSARGAVNVWLDDAIAEPFHAVIDMTGETVILRDLNSTAGTLVNEERVDSFALCSGDLITIGSTKLVVTLRSRSEAVAPAGTAKHDPSPAASPWQAVDRPPAAPRNTGALRRRMEQQRRVDRGLVVGGLALSLITLIVLPVFGMEGLAWFRSALGLQQPAAWARAQPAVRLGAAGNAVAAAALVHGATLHTGHGEQHSSTASTQARAASGLGAAGATETRSAPLSASRGAAGTDETDDLAARDRAGSGERRHRRGVSSRASGDGAGESPGEAARIARPLQREDEGLRPWPKAREERLRMADVAHTVDAYVHLLRPCVATGVRLRELQAGNHLLVLSWQVGLGGQPVEPQVQGPHYLRGTRTAACIENRMLDWRFSLELVGTTITNFPLPTSVPAE